MAVLAGEDRAGGFALPAGAGRQVARGDGSHEGEERPEASGGEKEAKEKEGLGCFLCFFCLIVFFWLFSIVWI